IGVIAAWILLPTEAVWSDSFFYQAEAGIRDDLVTGVQTCALPSAFKNTAGSTKVSRRAPELASDGQVLPSAWNIPEQLKMSPVEIGRASCREKVATWGGAQGPQLKHGWSRATGGEYR